LLHGESLCDRLQRESHLHFRETANIMIPVCAALAAAHSVGVIHRDMKPENIFLSRTRRGALRPKLVDFGVSKFMPTGGEDLSLTKTGIVLGTPYYMSPEQATGRGGLDERADQYAVGVILYECLSGRVPFGGENLLQVAHAIAVSRPAP